MKDNDGPRFFSFLVKQLALKWKDKRNCERRKEIGTKGKEEAKEHERKKKIRLLVTHCIMEFDVV